MVIMYIPKDYETHKTVGISTMPLTTLSTIYRSGGQGGEYSSCPMSHQFTMNNMRPLEELL